MFEGSCGLLPLKNDYMFRKIFGDPADTSPLRSFIEAVGCLTEEELVELTLVDPQLLPDDPTGKRGTPDLIVRARSGTSVHLEMQVLRIPFFDRRMVFYIATEIVKMLKTGASWGDIGRIISIIILDWNMTKEGEGFHKVFHISEDTTGELFTDAVEIHVMELKRLPVTGGGRLGDWLRLIAAERREDMEMIAARSPDMEKVFMRVQRLSADDNTRMILEAREREARDWASRISEGIIIGKEQGITIGKEQGIIIGKEQGIIIGEARGKEQGKFSTLFGLVRDGILSASDAAARAGTGFEDFTARMNAWYNAGVQTEV